MTDVRVLHRTAFLPQSEVSLKSWPKLWWEAWHTVYTRWSRSCCSRHLSREAGAFDSLGSLFDLVLVAASVCSNHLTGSRFHMNWKHKHAQWLECTWRLSAHSTFYDVFHQNIIPINKRYFWNANKSHEKTKTNSINLFSFWLHCLSHSATILFLLKMYI